MTTTFDLVDPSDPEARRALLHYLREVASNLTNPAVRADESDDVDDFRAPSGAFIVVREDTVVVGCGAVRTIAPGIGEIKRMWIRPSHRGRGHGAALLDRLEGACRSLGHHTVRLDTNETLVVAMSLYESHGYHQVAPYNRNPDATHFYEKRLA